MFRIGDNIKKARKVANMSQKVLSDKADIQQRDLNRMEKNALSVDAEKLYKICIATGVSADLILGIREWEQGVHEVQEVVCDQ